MSFLDEPSQPFHFTRAKDDELPFDEPLVIRAGVVSFASSFRAGSAAGLDEDVRFLRELPAANCAYGAADMPILPFVCELGSDAQPTARKVLDALGVPRWKSEHIASLDALTIPFPGYHPDTDNDEIHDDASEQCLFERPQEGKSELHEKLRDYVAERHLWYVLAHTLKKPSRPNLQLPAELQRTYWFADYAILLAVGRSKNRLVGVISHQVCHNLCD